MFCSLSLFTSCNDDDEKLPPIDAELVGSYLGAMDITLSDVSVAEDLVQKVYVSKADNKAIKIELKDFKVAIGGGELAIGDITVDRCEVVDNNGLYAFTGMQKLDLMVGVCDVAVQGTITGNKINLDINVEVGAPLSQTVKVKYAGEKLSGNESAEANITNFTFNSELVMEQPVIDEAKGEITFKVNDAATIDDLKALIPMITVSEKAIVTPGSEVAQDFSNNNKVMYKVIAEDGTVKTYTAFVAASLNILKYSFEEWSDALGGKYTYYNPLPANQLATPNAGVTLLYSIAQYKGEYPVLMEEAGMKGKGVKLVTRYTKTSSSIPPTITAGSLFTGEMKITISSLNNPLGATHFGIPYAKKPLRFKGYYKYTPGATFYDGTNKGNVVIDNKIDECSISAVLYQIEKDADYLDGTNINDSDKRIAIAQLKDGTAKNEYTEFDLSFELFPNKSYDPNAKYKIAIICSASKEGDAFKGAPDSTLWLDELEVIGE